MTQATTALIENAWSMVRDLHVTFALPPTLQAIRNL